MCVRLPCLLLLAAVATPHATRNIKTNGAGATSTDVSPIQKILQMLGDMVAKGKSEKQQEMVEFSKKQALCSSVQADKKRSIKEAGEQIEQLQADVDKAASDAAALAKEVDTHTAEISEWKADGKSALAKLKVQREDYAQQHAAMEESIAENAKAIQILKMMSPDTKAASLLQVKDMAGIPADEKAKIESLVAMQLASEQQPAVNAYETHGGGVLAILEKMKDQFAAQKTSLEKKEMQTEFDFETLMQQLHNDIATAEDAVAKKTAVKAEKLETAATSKNDMVSLQKVKADDEKTLSDSLADCASSSKEYEQNQMTRAAEIKALEEATQVLNSDSVSGGSASLLQSKKATMLLQLTSSSSDPELRQKILEFLQGRAQRTGSRFLALAAAHAADDPLLKVKKMLKDLVVKLMEQANSEADHHAYCESEMSTNKLQRDNQGSEVTELTAQIDELTAASASLMTEIQEMSDEISTLKSDMKEATDIRFEEKAVNNKAIDEAKAAQASVQKARKVLEGFYGKSSAMLQHTESLGEAMKAESSKPYTGMSSDSGGVFGMLEVIMSDFARLEAETTTAEEQAASQYEKFMDESQESVAVKEVEVKHKTDKKRTIDERNESLQKERTLTQGELSAANEYYDKLKADCVDTGVSYEARVEARNQEIDSLKEALAFLTQDGA